MYLRTLEPIRDHPSLAAGRIVDIRRLGMVAASEAAYAHLSRCMIARPITQSLSLSERKGSSSVKCVMRWR